MFLVFLYEFCGWILVSPWLTNLRNVGFSLMGFCNLWRLTEGLSLLQVLRIPRFSFACPTVHATSSRGFKAPEWILPLLPRLAFQWAFRQQSTTDYWFGSVNSFSDSHSSTTRFCLRRQSVQVTPFSTNDEGNSICIPQIRHLVVPWKWVWLLSPQ